MANPLLFNRPSRQRQPGSRPLPLLQSKEMTKLTDITKAILPSLPLEYWHPNALGKIRSRLGTPIAMDSLTMKMERISYARILVEVDASKNLVDQVEFILSNGVARKQPIVYKFAPKFYSACNRFGHLKDSCQTSAAAAAKALAVTVKIVAPKKVPPTE
ncbi:UNVERIFIED_CONTAM: hypothetical protein Slati_4165300 [Sesamum latifolium]|uniref:DUF4283 domain-containing protein n=1 Tax=Sesamum latifolium TaxID=2727402 RepID=A0AAW2T9A7_9LAMI